MMKSRRDNIRSPNRKNNIISRPLSRLNKNTLVAAARQGVQSATSTTASNIKVVVRVRPPNSKESGENHRITVKVVDENVLIFDPKENAEPFFYHGVQQKTRDLLKKTQKDIQFIFNKVFDWDIQNAEVYENSTKPLINCLMDGINCSVFAYGATGAGKTYTMLGNASNPGITFLTMEELFATREELSRERDFEMGITYLEVYNETVQDLLKPGAALTLREDSKFGVVVAGLTYVQIGSANELYSLLEQGNQKRTQHPTDANAESSRSHAVFQVYLRMKFKVTGEVRMAKLSMIDLAGSERGSATNFQGARFAEGANINKSLLALGNCINSLADSQRHVPYRDSKLTRLLKDSLGGNCQTVMIANISPSSLSYEDTYNTLRYATRAKAIKATIKRNVVNIELKVEQYAKIVEELNREIARTKAELKELKEQRSENVSIDMDPCFLREVDENFNRRRNLIEKLYAMEISEQIVQLRSQVKEDANSRLSGLCFDSSDKEERHRKLDNTIYRCYKQTETFREEIDSLNALKMNLKKESQILAEKYPTGKLMIDLKEMELEKLEEQYKNQLNQKQIRIYQEELHQRGDLIERMSSVLKPCFLQLKGMGYASDKLTDDYESIISHSQGVKSIKWEDEINNPVPDSGVCSSTTLNAEDAVSSCIPDSRSEFSSPTRSPAPTRRPVATRSPSAMRSPAPIERLPIGDVTFSINTPRKKTPLKTAAKPRVCADQILVKAYKPSPLKKTKLNNATSLRMKENLPNTKTVKKPFHTVNPRIQLKKGTTTGAHSARNHPTSSRPIVTKNLPKL